MSKRLSRRSRDFFTGIPNIYSASPDSGVPVDYVRYKSVDALLISPFCWGQLIHIQYHRPEIAVDMFGNLSLDGFEKTLQFSWDFADGNHTASLLIGDCLHNTYRQSKLFLFDNRYHQNSRDRSV